MKKHLKIFLCYFRLNFASALEYRAAFLSQAFGMALSNSSFIFFWWIAFNQIGGTIADYSFRDIVFIWAATSTGYGISLVLFANASRISNLIVTGELDVFLLQPCNILLNVICARTSFTAYRDFFYGIILMIIFYSRNANAWLWFIVGALIYALLLVAIYVCVHTLSFFIGDASTVGTLATEFAINFAIYPEKIYAPVIRSLMYSLIPVGIAVHIPLKLYTTFSPSLAVAAFCAVVIYCIFTYWFFYRGLKRYESGNAIVTRL